MDAEAVGSRGSGLPRPRAVQCALVVLALLCLGACGEPGPGGQETSAPLSVLHRGNTGEPSSLDPHKIAGVWESHIARDLFVGLLTEAADASPIPGAAQGYSVSPDGLSYRFDLRKGHTWSDGVPVTAGDFVFAFRRVLAPATRAPYASLLYVLKNGRAVHDGTADPSALGARAEGPDVLILDLEKPAPFLPRLLTHQTAYPVPRHVIETAGEGWVRPGVMVSNGPYVLTEWRPGTHVRLDKNKAFDGAAEVVIDRVYYYPTEDRTAALERFKAGALDINDDFPIQQLEILRRTRPDDVRIAPFLLTHCIYLNTSVAPFDNPDVRRALAMAIDRTILARDIMRSGQNPAFAFVPPDIAGYPGTAALSFRDQTMEERLGEARALMAAAGIGPQTPLRITLRHREGQDHRNVAIALGAMWRRIHVETELVGVSIKAHYAALSKGDFTIADGGWAADYNDAENYLFMFESTSGVLNYSNYNNPDFDARLRAAKSTADAARRGALLVEAEQILLNDMPVIPTFVDTSRNLVAGHVQGWIDNIEDKHPTRYLSLTRSPGGTEP